MRELPTAVRELALTMLELAFETQSSVTVTLRGQASPPITGTVRSVKKISETSGSIELHGIDGNDVEIDLESIAAVKLHH